MQFSELKGPRIKKSLNLKRISKNYHNKHKSGSGNFGFFMVTQAGDKFDLRGMYDSTGRITSLSFGKAYGGAYVVMCSRHIGADVVLGWPTTECAVMGSEGAANIIFRKEIAAAKDPDQALQEKIDEYRDKFANPWIAASHGFIDDVIEPRETRSYVFRAFEMLRNKRKTRPPRKHGNIPL